MSNLGRILLVEDDPKDVELIKTAQSQRTGSAAADQVG